MACVVIERDSCSSEGELIFLELSHDLSFPPPLNLEFMQLILVTFPFGKRTTRQDPNGPQNVEQQEHPRPSGTVTPATSPYAAVNLTGPGSGLT